MTDDTRPWFCARASGRETRARFYLERGGYSPFFPVIHKYFRHKGGREGMRVKALMPGYVFFRAENAADAVRASRAIGVACVLGSWIGERFAAREMPIEWIGSIPDITVEGKAVAFAKGDRVKRAVSALAEIIGQVQGIDKRGNICVAFELLGKRHTNWIAASELMLAETATDTAESSDAAQAQRAKRARKLAKTA